MGLNKQIQESDIYEAAESHKSYNITQTFKSAWSKQKSSASPNLLSTIVSIYGVSVLSFGFIGTAVKCLSRILRPLFLGGLILYYTPNQSDVSLGQAYAYATGIVLCTILPLLLFHPMQLFYFESSMKMKIGCMSLIFDKILGLPASSKINELNGKVINLCSNDLSTLDYAVCFLQEIWVGPVEAIIMGYLIWLEIGYFGLVGIGVMIIFIPLQAWMGKMAASIRLRTALRTDARIKFMNEVIQGIKVIKLFAWEIVFASKVSAIRRRELMAIRQSAWIKATLLAFHVLPQIAIFSSFVLYAYFNSDSITSRKAFIVIAYFNALRSSLVDFWPLAITSVAEGYVSIKRIEEFLLASENSFAEKIADPNKKVFADNVTKTVEFQNATAIWSREEKSKAIDNITIKLEGAGLYAMVGPVGSGKSAMLQAILGEIELYSGEINVSGTLSYVSQRSWVFQGSVKSNILFNDEFDEEKYKEVVNVCGLQEDFSQMPFGDETLVGERGISLSGGQKARINLARAIYKDADIYLLDDPLSAVDVNVGKLIFHRCIRGYLKNKLCVLVTHQMQYISAAKCIIVMNKGCIESVNSFDNITSKSSNFSYLVRKNLSDTKNTSEESKEHMDKENDVELPTNNHQQQVVAKEKQMEGAVDIKVYAEYMKAAKSWWTVSIVFALFVATQVFMSGADLFVSIWTNWEEQTKESDTEWTTNRFVVVYSSIIVLLLSLIVTRSFGYYDMCIKISKNLHQMMYHGLVRATMYFFNVNPSGRVLNRFSKDIGNIDSYLPVVLVDTMIFFFEFVGVVVLISIVNYWLILPTIVMAVAFYALRYSFLTTARNVKRVEAITRSPIFSKINETVEGLSIIKVFGGQDAALRSFKTHQDVNSSASFLFIATTRGFAFWLDVTSALYLTVVTFAFLLVGKSSWQGGNVGLAITQAINLVGMCNWGLRQTSELENQMTSVERVLEYTKLEPEPPLETSVKPKVWPSHGVLEFKNVSMRYDAALNLVLKNISFRVEAGEKVGIVGRTGAGKSSICQAIFRLAEYEGDIVVDGINLKDLGLHSFRGSISIIPQDPTLFSGSLRSNIDPAERISDDMIWTALEQCELKPTIAALPNGLDTHVSDGGSNFSIGERQLICLARALVKNNKILILDEATANVDEHTEKLIQNSIRKYFIGISIITIAHRIHTVLDHDKILVVDKGELIEEGMVQNLLENNQSVFAQMVRESGLEIN